MKTMLASSSSSSSLSFFLLSFITLSTLTATNVASADNNSFATRRYKLYHNLGGTPSSPFVERGTIVLSNDPSILSSSSSSSSPGNDEKSLVVVAQMEEKDEEESSCTVDAKDVNNMVEQGTMYTIKVVDEESGSEAVASVNGCNVRRANFREEIELTIGHTGTLLSVSYTPLVSVLAPPCTSLSPLTPSDDNKFKTTASYQTSTPGMSVPLVLPSSKPPAGLKFFPQKSGAGAGVGVAGGGNNGAGAGSAGGGNPSPFATEEDAKASNKSFLLKYWYIFLPLFLIGLTSGVEEPEAAGAGAAGGSGAAAQGGANARGAAGGAAAGNAAAAAAGGGGQPVRRRGKRG